MSIPGVEAGSGLSVVSVGSEEGGVSGFRSTGWRSTSNATCLIVLAMPRRRVEENWGVDWSVDVGTVLPVASAMLEVEMKGVNLERGMTWGS